MCGVQNCVVCAVCSVLLYVQCGGVVRIVFGVPSVRAGQAVGPAAERSWGKVMGKTSGESVWVWVQSADQAGNFRRRGLR